MTEPSERGMSATVLLLTRHRSKRLIEEALTSGASISSGGIWSAGKRTLSADILAAVKAFGPSHDDRTLLLVRIL